MFVSATNVQIHSVKGNRKMNCEPALWQSTRHRYWQKRGTLDSELRPCPCRLIVNLRTEGARKNIEHNILSLLT